jgi:urease accessory protein
MIRITSVLGHASEPTFAERLHELEHRGQVEYLNISTSDSARHRLRAFTDAKTECGIALRRDESLFDGAVLCLDPDRAIVVRLGEEQWLRLLPHDLKTALELGYFAGNMHWRVRFEGEHLLIAISTSKADYIARMSEILSRGRVEIIEG